MTSDEKTMLVLAIIMMAGILIPFLSMANDLDAMRACEVEFSHAVCAHTLR